MLIPRSEVLRGSEFEHDAPSLGRKKVAHVQVPSGRPPLAGFRVCYLLHSFGGDRHSWARQGDGFLTGLASDVLFVFPESGRRWFMNDASGKRYEDYLLADLIPTIEATYPVDRAARSRIIGGFSMGGAGAIHLALRNPGVFSRAFAVAGAFYASERQGDPYASMRGGACMMPTEQEHDRVWGPVGSEVRRAYDTGRLIEGAAAGRAPALALEVGIEDYPRVVEMNRRVHRALDAAGVAHTYEEHPGDHGWPYATRAATRLLGRLLEPSTRPPDAGWPSARVG
ncbi:esterase [Myxococcus sp. AM011]|uniref:alpha/beta hydrolase n=1 Tax=Myxococcus sp. AM011 TaxID=2745200 RepID=UPI0015953CE4|nr:alpha/beta hydrolase-fold protein [Myxococcus sp. AM011]NVJ28565.1 esterase [Myxococcus sp. AM011]